MRRRGWRARVQGVRWRGSASCDVKTRKQGLLDPRTVFDSAWSGRVRFWEEATGEGRHRPTVLRETGLASLSRQRCTPIALTYFYSARRPRGGGGVRRALFLPGGGGVLAVSGRACFSVGERPGPFGSKGWGVVPRNGGEKARPGLVVRPRRKRFEQNYHRESK